MNPRLLAPMLVGALVVWGMCRRIRRSFGPQPLNARRLYLRAGIPGTVGVLLVFGLARTPALLGMLIGGLAGGAILGHVGLRHTRFEVIGQQRFYTPHTYIGVLLTVLFLGRILYRLLTPYSGANVTARADALQARPDPFAVYQHSPATLVIFGLLIGYYVFFSIGVLKKGRDLPLPTTGLPGQ